jgi:AcrR family transcriptional regulator
VKRGPEPSKAQWRVIDAALKLFAQNGVGGTSLRMIASELGVTVAAVYHQFHTKDEIIFAAVQSQLRELEAVVDAAEAVPTVSGARDALIIGIVDLAVGGVGHQVSAVLSDPIVVGSFDRHPEFLDLLPRMRRLLIGGETTREPRIRTATLIAVIGGAATHPFVADYDEETLRSELLLIAHLLVPPLPAADRSPGNDQRRSRGPKSKD